MSPSGMASKSSGVYVSDAVMFMSSLPHSCIAPILPTTPVGCEDRRLSPRTFPVHPITIRYSFRPVRRSLATNQVADLFGLTDHEPPHTVADCVSLDVRPGELVLFTGPSGS